MKKDKMESLSIEEIEARFNESATLSFILTFIPCVIACDRFIESDVLAVLLAMAVTYFLVILAVASGALSERAEAMKRDRDANHLL